MRTTTAMAVTLREILEMSKVRDPKKTIALAALGIVLLGVGAFQFVGMGGSAPKKHSTSKITKSSKSHKASAKTDDRDTIAGTKKSDTGATPSVGDVADNSEPTQSQSEQPGTSATEPPKDAGQPLTEHTAVVSGGEKEDIATEAATIEDINSSVHKMQSVAQKSLAVRDPFAVPEIARDKNKQTPIPPKVVTPGGNPGLLAAGASPNSKAVGKADATAAKANSSVAPMPIGNLPKAIPGAQLPTADGGAKPGDIALKSSAPLRTEDEFAFSLAGIAMGSRPLAILQDDSGKQRMVALGNTVGGGKVVKITPTAVTVEYKGKRVTLRIGGGSGQT